MHFIQYLNLPAIPDHVVTSLDLNPDKHKLYHNAKHIGPYIWSDMQTQILNDWCKTNISADLHYGLQLMTGDVAIHRDIDTRVKINYLINTGGPRVETGFYDDDQKTKIDSYRIERGRWHIFQASVAHDVTRIETLRISVTARIF